jgi:hypothetical protein
MSQPHLIAQLVPPERKAVLWLLLAVAALAGYIVLIDWIPKGGLVDLIIVVAASIAGAVSGRSLPLFVRFLITGLLFDFAYGMCLTGRTMEPGLSRYTVGMAFFCFFIYALGLLLSLLRVWSIRAGLTLLSLAFPVSFAIAALVAGFEERQFMELHRATGIGPTARWTVSNHWLSYDLEKQQLYGSD